MTSAPRDEQALIARLRGGDEQLFREVVIELTPVLLRLAQTYTRTPSASQDAVQETWVVVLDKLDGFQGRSTFKTWVCGILVHTARRTGVREARSVPFSDSWFAGREPAVDARRFAPRAGTQPPGTWTQPPVRWDQIPEERLAEKELRQVIDAAIAQLPQRQREVITARDVVGMDAAEAQLVLGLSSGNLRVLLHRARSKVRAALEQYGSDLSADPSAPAGEPT